MDYRLHPDLILRQEFFGGFLHSRSSGNRWELSAEDGIFLWALDQTGDLHEAVDIVSHVFTDKAFIPALDLFLAEGIVILGVSDELRATNPFDDAQVRLVESRQRDYLRAPVNLSIYPYMACQLNCAFCYITPEKWVRHAEPVEKWVQVLQQAKAMGIPFVSILGGDPSLYPEIARLIRAFGEIGVKGSITTNGLHMSQDMYDALISTDLMTPTISVQSLDKYHEDVTGCSQRKTLATIQRLRTAGKPCNINVVYTEQTDKQMIDLVDFCLEQGVEKLSVGVFVNITKSTIPVPSFSAYRRLHEMIMAYLEGKQSTLVFQVEGCQLYTAYPEYPTDPVETSYESLVYGCDAGNGRFEIMYDGSGLPCALLNMSRWGSGNVFEKGVQAVWDTGETLRRIRSYKNTDNACNSCRFGHFCNGGCPALNEVSYGTIEHTGDARCEIRQEILHQTPLLGRYPLSLTVLN